ncbi:MAG: DinB family protein [Thermoanaerobaculia bacterium]|nr:DinB family protein [Thermoanaerobaculia bacterium]
MYRSRVLAALLCALVLASSPALFAEHHETETNAYQRNVDFVAGRVVQLAEAIPAEAYGWRPMEGVRSVSEAIMHMAAANYFFAGRLGTPAPEGVDPQNMEQITDKAECVAALEASMKHIVAALGRVEDLDAAMDVFGREATAHDMVLIAVGHAHEHFGQLIAYARANQVVPPWSQ